MSVTQWRAGDPRSRHASVPAQVVKWVEQLQRDCAEQSGGQVLLLVDPAVRRPEDDGFDGPLFQRWQRVEVPIRHAGLPSTHRPYLLALDLHRYMDAELLRASVRMAWEDRQAGVIGRSQGHRIGGWLASRAEATYVAAHISRHAVQIRGGRSSLFRFYDMRCLTWLWPLLKPWQQRNLLGPVSCWHILDATHQQQALLPPPIHSTDDKAVAELALDEQQWRSTQRIGIVNRALAAYQHEHGDALESTQLPHAWAAAGRALNLQLDDDDDAAALVIDALQTHPMFDTHPEISSLLQKRHPGEFYRAIVSDLEPADFTRIRDDLSALNIQGGR